MINTVALRFGATLKSTINESDSVVLIVERRERNHFVSMHDPRLKHRAIPVGKTINVTCAQNKMCELDWLSHVVLQYR